MGRVVGHIAGVDYHPKGVWDRIHLEDGQTVYMRRQDVERMKAAFGTDTPPVEFEFEVNSLMHQVQTFAPTTSGRAAVMHAGLAQYRKRLVEMGFTEEMDYGQHFPEWRAEFCFVESEVAEHGTVNCILVKGHAGSHRGQCIACKWTADFLAQAERNGVRLG